VIGSRSTQRRITIDLDPTDDPTHGQQEFTFFNGHYDTWCYLPIVATVTFNDEPAQFAVAAVLRPATRPPRGGRGAPAALARKAARGVPTAPFRVRLDGGFAHRNCSGSSSSSRSSTSWRWPATRAWRSAARRLMGKARIGPRPPVSRRICMGRRGMPHGAGSASAG